MKIIESMLTKNPYYKLWKKITVGGLMLHSVGCPQPSAMVFIKQWNLSSFTRACIHAFIDGNTGDVYQTLPWDHRAPHCGSGKKGSGNNTHIGVEMCEPACIKYIGGSKFTCSNVSEAKAVVKRTYESAVELFAMLCKQYNLDPLADGVIISHKEGHARGIAGNHGDPEHLWNQLGMGYTMDTFRQAVKDAMKEEPVYNVQDYVLVFNPTYYAEKYSDLKAAFGTDEKKLFEHFIMFGMDEGRQAIESFNVQAYKNRYEDLRNAFGDELPKYYEHYIQFGYNEKRDAM